MAESMIDTTLAVPDEALSPREQRLERAAQILQIGAAACGVIAALILLAALVAAFGASGLLVGARNVLLARYTGADDTALAIVILLSLLNMSLLLVLMVGVLARELWALPGLWIFALANGAGMLLAGFTPGLVALAAAVIASGVLSRDIRAFRLNPVMLKELRGRMRGMRAFVVMTVYLGLMSGFATLLYLLYTTGMRTSASAAAGEIGRVLFMGIVGIE